MNEMGSSGRIVGTGEGAGGGTGAEGSPVCGVEVLVGVTGGIAAYKTATVVSRLVQAGALVTVAMTDGAARFVTPLTFQALSGRPVYTGVWEHIESQDPQHIRLAERARVAVVAPCTMHTLGKLAHGLTDDVVTLILSAVDRSRTPVLLAPSMNTVMWEQASTRRNVETLRGDGFVMIEPGVGWQACRHVGKGRMAEAEEIVAAVEGAVRC